MLSTCCTLYSTSATLTIGTAAATLTNPYFIACLVYLGAKVKKKARTTKSSGFFLLFRCLVVDRTSDDIKQFARNRLLATLIVLQVKLTQQLIGIIRSCLHGHHTGSML